MAKGNMLQGMARGKVGDVVFSRLNGEQIARVRNRNPKNPRTNAQLYQRAIMATVMAAYSAGKVVFDHSFQGYAVGEANQRRFMSENAKHLRSLIAADLANDVEVGTQNGRVVAPGVSTPVPTLYKVSEGSLVNTLLGYNIVAATVGNETVAQYCARLGVQADDLYTIVGFYNPADSTPVFELHSATDGYSKQYPCQFVYARFTVKAEALTSTAAMENLGQVLEFSEGNFTPNSIAKVTPDDRFDLTALLPTDSWRAYSCANIRSRVGQDLRSTETMIARKNEYGSGIASSYALAAWKQGTESIGDSDLILEGGNQ